MRLKDAIDRTQNFFRKTHEKLKCLFIRGYKKLPKKRLSFSPFSCLSFKPESHHNGQIYTGFLYEWESSLQQKEKRNDTDYSIRAPKDLTRQENVNCEGGLPKQSPVCGRQERGAKESKKEESCSGEIHKVSRRDALAKRMKELEVMEGGDLEQMLDIEEALHYYSRLKSPAYQDIVDKFLTDMYSEISVPEASLSTNNSRRRIDSIRV